MHLGFHGGKCCGIKIIYDFGYGPTSTTCLLAALEALDFKQNHDACGQNVKSDMRFFHEAAPEETRLQRLDRYIEYCRQRRPNGIIEVCLSDGASSDEQFWNQVHWWDALLKERGFVVVTTCRNSNSGNKVHVYHLVMDEPVSGYDPDEDNEDAPEDDDFVMGV